MPAQRQRLTVSSPQEMEQTIASYIAQGYAVVHKTKTSATMFKKKEFSILWAVVGFLFCLLPLLIYIIYYATQSDQMVEIIVATE
jgi:uncharacterized membrane protein YukC